MLDEDRAYHGPRTPSEEITFTARPKIKSQSQIFRYGRSIFCLPHWPKISDFFDLCLHWVSVVRGKKSGNEISYFFYHKTNVCKLCDFFYIIQRKYVTCKGHLTILLLNIRECPKAAFLTTD